MLDFPRRNRTIITVAVECCSAPLPFAVRLLPMGARSLRRRPQRCLPTMAAAALEAAREEVWEAAERTRRQWLGRWQAHRSNIRSTTIRSSIISRIINSLIHPRDHNRAPRLVCVTWSDNWPNSANKRQNWQRHSNAQSDNAPWPKPLGLKSSGCTTFICAHNAASLQWRLRQPLLPLLPLLQLPQHPPHQAGANSTCLCCHLPLPLLPLPLHLLPLASSRH